MVSEQLLDYIKQQLTSGISQNTIQDNLKAKNWSTEDIKLAFNQINNISQTADTPQNQIINPPKVNNSENTPFYKSGAFVVLSLVIFWPVGLFLMWKYMLWRKLVKILITLFFLVGTIPLFFIIFLRGLLFGYQVNEKLHPGTVGQSQNYVCQPVDSQWSKCISQKYHLSFEYPSNWYYIDLPTGEIALGDQQNDLTNSYIFYVSKPHEYNLDSAKRILPTISGNSVITVNGMWGVKYEPTSTDSLMEPHVSLINNNTMYDFYMSASNMKKRNYTSDQIKQINVDYDHIVQSFKPE